MKARLSALRKRVVALHAGKRNKPTWDHNIKKGVEIKVRVFSVYAALISYVFYYLFNCATCFGPILTIE
jgi:hypothetical protein